MIRKSYSSKSDKFSPNRSASISSYKSSAQVASSNNLFVLTEELARLKEEEQKNLNEIAELESRQIQFFQDRKSFLFNYKKAKTRSRQAPEIVTQLQENIGQLTTSYSNCLSDSFRQNEKLNLTISTINDEIQKEKENLLQSTNELNKLQSNHQSRQEIIEDLNSKYQQLQKDSEYAKNENMKCEKELQRYTQKIEELSLESESEIEKNEILMQQFNELQEKVDQLNATKQLVQKREKEKLKLNEDDLDPILQRTKEYRKDLKEYINSIADLKENELFDINYQIDRLSKELSHLMAAHEERRNRQLFVKDQNV